MNDHNNQNNAKMKANADPVVVYDYNDAESPPPNNKTDHDIDQVDNSPGFSPDRNSLPGTNYGSQEVQSLKKRVRALCLGLIVFGIIILILVIVLGVNASKLQKANENLGGTIDEKYIKLFQQWKDDNDKTYSNNDQEQIYYQNFVSNVLQLESYYDFRNMTFDYKDLSKYADLPEYEFKGKYLGLEQILSANATVVSFANKTSPSYIDWTQKGYVTPVKNQSQCSASHIFAVIGAIESAIMIKKNSTILPLSEQAVIDCMILMKSGITNNTGMNQGGKGGQGGGPGGPGGPGRTLQNGKIGDMIKDFFGNLYNQTTNDNERVRQQQQQKNQQGLPQGKTGLNCRGGDPEKVMTYLSYNNTIFYQKDYPYIGTQSMCKNSTTNKTSFRVTNFYSINNNASELIAALAQQPIIAGIDSSSLYYMKDYILDENSYCPNRRIDHLVLIVGYSNGYFKVKNSWGDDWGDNGYFYVKNIVSPEGTGVCGLLSYLRYPSVAL